MSDEPNPAGLSKESRLALLRTDANDLAIANAEISRLRSINADMLAALIAASHALKSYAYGNSATAIAKATGATP